MLSNPEILKLLGRVFVHEANGKPLDGMKHPVNFFVRGDYPESSYDACWDVVNREWVKTPQRTPMDFDPETAFPKAWKAAETLAREFDIELGRLGRDLKEYEILIRDMQRPGMRPYLERKIRAVLERLETEFRELSAQYDAIHKERVESFSRDPDEAREAWMVSRNWNNANITYKLLERWQYIKVLVTLQKIWKDMEEGFEKEAQQLMLPHIFDNIPLHQKSHPVNQENLRRFMQGSHVVDERGKPLVVFHLSTGEFREFDPKYNYDYYREHYDTWGAKMTEDDLDSGYVQNMEPEDESEYSPSISFDVLSALGTHFGTKEASEARFSFLSRGIPFEIMWEEYEKNPYEGPTPPQYNVWPCYLSIKNPLGTMRQPVTEEEIRDIIRTKGLHEIWNKYDGVIYKNDIEAPGSVSFIVFSPNQIKSALGNAGTYDPTSIRHEASRRDR